MSPTATFSRLIPLLLLAITTLHHACSAEPFGRADCLNMSTACPENRCQCSCEWNNAHSNYIVDCPPASLSDSPNVTFTVAPGHFFGIECRTPNVEFRDLPNMDLGDVEKLLIKDCALSPFTTIGDLMRRFGIRSLKGLYIIHDKHDFAYRRQHFAGLGIKRMSLSAKGLTELPDDFFAEIRNITWLEIKQTEVHRIKNALAVLTQLKTFEMPANSIAQLEEGAFEHLNALESLMLYSNQLLALGPDDFRGLANLRALELLANRIQRIHPDAFVALPNIRFVGLRRNELKTLPEGLFRVNALLEEVKVNDNAIAHLPADLFANIAGLRVVQADNSNVETVPETVFANSTGITNITLNGNKIATLAPRTFFNLTSLLHLALQNNLLAQLPGRLFMTLRQLRHLDLSNNRLETLPSGIFQDQVNLNSLLLGNNQLKSIDYGTFDFTKSLRHLDLSHNQLQFPGQSLISDTVRQSPLQKLTTLEQLNLSHNQLQHLHSDFSFVMTNLRALDLSYNNISFVQFQHLQFKDGGVLVDLRHNRISTVDFSAYLVISRENQRPSSPANVHLDANPLTCDCDVLDFAHFLHMPEDRRHLNMHVGNLTCQQPARLQGRLLSTVQPEELLCDFGADYSCPAECSCARRPVDRALIVNCSNAGLHELPPLPLPSNLSLAFTILHAENNFLSTLPPVDALRGYAEVRGLHVAGNNLTTITPAQIPAHLADVDLSRNHLQNISPEAFGRLNRTRLRLAGNRWACDCAMRHVLSFMQLHYRNISDYDQLRCLGSGRKISALTTGDICPQETQFIIVLSVSLACLCLVAGLLAALYYKYQQEIKIWMYWHRILPFLFNSDVLDSDKKYDAFISYSHKDEDFVTDLLMPELEQKRRFNLCIHRRDWTPGDFIPEQIVRSVSESRRTLIVLSPNYVESVWGTMEFRTAHRSAMADQVNRVIVIVYGKVDRDKLDPELKSYIDMNTYIEWGDPWFWERLHYALRTIHTKKKEAASGLKKTPLKSSVDDKLELIHPSPINSPLNTPPAEHPLSYKQNGHVNGAFIINTNSKQSDV